MTDLIRNSIENAILNQPDEIFESRDDGIYYIKTSMGRNQKVITQEQRICAPVEIVAKFHDPEVGDKWGLLLKWSDPKAKSHEQTIFYRQLEENPKLVRGSLMDAGLKIYCRSGSGDLFIKYLVQGNPERTASIATRTGYFEDGDKLALILPYGPIKNRQSNLDIIFKGQNNIKGIEEAGTLLDWQQTVGQLSLHSKRMMFAIQASLASLLLKPLGLQSQAFHFVGNSSSGKSTILKVTSSVMGTKDLVLSWRATDNGLEATAIALCDMPLLCDELGQNTSPHTIDQVIYMIGNGTQKIRATIEGKDQEVKHFRNVIISTGEKDVQELLNSVGKEATAGVQIRLPGIPADAGCNLGVLESLPPSCTDFEQYEALLKQATNDNHGVIFRKFAEYILEVVNSPQRLQKLKESYASHVRKFSQKALARDFVHPEIKRVTNGFALVSFTGGLAAHQKIISWSETQAQDCVYACHKAWLDNQTSPHHSYEEQELLERMRKLFDQQQNHFSYDAKDSWGTIDGNGHLVMCVSAYKEHIVQSRNAYKLRWVNKFLIDNGWLIPDKTGKSSQVISNQRQYVLKDPESENVTIDIEDLFIKK